MIPSSIRRTTVFIALSWGLVGSGWAAPQAEEPATPEAQFEQAIRYLEGDGVRRDEGEGIRWLKRAAEAGFLPAQNHLAICYRTGTGFTFKSRRKAERWFLRAAEAGYPPAMINLAQAYLENDPRGGMETAGPWLERAASFELDSELPPGDAELFAQVKAEASARLGDFHREGDALEEAFEAYAVAARLGNLHGQLQVARCHALGLGTPVDLARASRFLDNAGHNLAAHYRRVSETWFTAAAISAQAAYTIEEQGAREARQLVRQMRVGIANEMAEAATTTAGLEAEGVLAWFREAAEAGSDFAAARAAILWLRGEARGELGAEEVRAYLERAEEGGVIIAAPALAYYWAEVAPQPDATKAAELYRKARQEGYFAAHLALQGDRSILPMTLQESMALASRHAPPDEPAAAGEVLEEGALHALFACGLATWLGIGEAERDRGLAAKRFRRAAQQGHPEAAFYVGLAYLSGELHKFSLFDARAGEKEAYRWLEEGAAQGSKNALYMLGLFNMHGVSLSRPDLDRALDAFGRLRDVGDVARGGYGAGLVHLRRDDPVAAAEAFSASAKAGYADSMIYLAYLLTEDDEPLPRDLERARHWSEAAIAAEPDDARGHFFLGRVFELMEPPQLPEAYLEFERAAVNGHLGGIEKVAPAYARGDVLPWKPSVAAGYFRTLLEKGKHEYADDLIIAVHATGDETALRDAVDQVLEAGVSSGKARLFESIFNYEDARRADDRRRHLEPILDRARRGDEDAQTWILKRFRGIDRPLSAMRKFAAGMTAEDNPDGYYYLALCVRHTERWKIDRDPEAMIREAAAAGSLPAIEALAAQRSEGAPGAPPAETLKQWLAPLVERGLEEAIELYEQLLEEEAPAVPDRPREGVSGYTEEIA